MKCIRCDGDNTVCLDDMIQELYIAEIYKCNDCGGVIEVEYIDKNMVIENIKKYRYIQ